MLPTWTGQCFLQPYRSLGVDWVPDIQAQSAPKVTNTCSLQALQRKEMPQSDPAHLEGLEKGDQGICKWPNSSGCCFKCDHVEFQCDPMCSVPACHACDTLLPLCQPTLGPGVDLRWRMGIIMFIINSICIYIYINKGHRSVVALKAKKPACGGAERGLRMNMNELIIWGLPGPSGFVWKCLTPSSNEFQWIVIFATNVAANFSGLLDADAPLGAMARSWEASSAPFRFLGQWDAIENMIYQKLIMVYGSLWQFMTVMLYQISNLCIFMWQVGVPWFLGTLTGSK